MKKIKDVGLKYPTSTSKIRRRYSLYECPICGNHFECRDDTIKGYKSCGCSKEKHSKTGTRLYRIWNKMKDRCYNPNHSKFEYYGGSGIKICDSWKNSFINFEKWAMQNGYSDTLSIDRIDIYGDYTPDNCRWETQYTQCRNTRCIRSTNTSGFRGVSYDKSRDKWEAYITIEHRKIHLGRFNSALEAAIRYDTYVMDNKLEHTINNVIYTNKDRINE